ncbi:WXG100 family type VII secretion target [Streptomyces sp. NPDC058961]|uniref:WXG100 family type VII secretion target n=1 Tax=Streptomyces sp. NPDC058961 TaxID=3346680 RepID=UPI0036AD083C
MPNYSDDVLGVTYGSLDEAVIAIRAQAAKLQQDLDEINRLVKTAAQNWHGEAQTAFATEQQGWDRDAQVVQQSLKQIGDAVAEAGPTYRAGDRKAAGYFHQ